MRRSRSTGSGGPDQHLAVIPAGGDPADPIADEAVAGEVDGTVAIATDDWDPGTYVALLMDGSSVRSRTRFWIEAPGDGPHVSTSRHGYGVGDPIDVHWWNAPGARWDWIGVYPPTRRSERRLLPDLVLHALDDPGLRAPRRRLRRPVAPAGRSIQRLSVGG